jgi:hypothetical protein
MTRWKRPRENTQRPRSQRVAASIPQASTTFLMMANNFFQPRLFDNSRQRSTTMYCDINFKTKKELKLAVAAGQKIGIFAPGMGTPKANGRETLEGPHFPKPHTWYAEVMMKDGYIVSVK